MATHRHDDREPLRQHLLSAQELHDAENAAQGCFSLHERYQRLRNGIFSRAGVDGDRTRSHNSSGLTSTTRGIHDDLQSGELPQPGMHRHLGQQVREQFDRSAQNSREEELGIPEHGRVPQEPCRREPSPLLDLDEQNQIWIDDISTGVHFEASDLRYAPSSVSSSSSDPEMGTTLEEDTPFRNAPPLPPICSPEDEPSISGDEIVRPEALVELARNGEFFELWSALKRARLQQNRGLESSEFDVESIYYSAVDTFISEWQEMMSIPENEPSNAVMRSGQTVYFDAADALTSAEIDEGHSHQRVQQIVGELALSPSFQTCDTWYRQESNLGSRELDPQISSQRFTPMERWQRSVRRAIVERADIHASPLQHQRKCVLVLTKGPRLSSHKELPKRNLQMPLVARMSRALREVSTVAKFVRWRRLPEEEEPEQRRGINCDARYPTASSSSSSSSVPPSPPTASSSS